MRKNIKIKISTILIASIFAMTGCGNNSEAENAESKNLSLESEVTTISNESDGAYEQSKEEPENSNTEKEPEESNTKDSLTAQTSSDNEEATTKQTQITSQASTTAKHEEATTKQTQITSQAYTTAGGQTTTTKQTQTSSQATTPARQETTTKKQVQTPTTTKAETTTKEFGSAIEQGKRLYTKYLSYLQEVLKYTNEVRAEAGVAPLVLDETLSIAASGRSAEMDYYNYFAHTRPDGSSCFNILDEVNAKWNYVGENIAWGYPNPKDVVEGWKNSPGHYANMVNPDFKKLGVGVSNEYSGRIYWTQLFTN